MKHSLCIFLALLAFSLEAAPQRTVWTDTNNVVQSHPGGITFTNGIRISGGISFDAVAWGLTNWDAGQQGVFSVLGSQSVGDYSTTVLQFSGYSSLGETDEGVPFAAFVDPRFTNNATDAGFPIVATRQWVTDHAGSGGGGGGGTGGISYVVIATGDNVTGSSVDVTVTLTNASVNVDGQWDTESGNWTPPAGTYLVEFSTVSEHFSNHSSLEGCGFYMYDGGAFQIFNEVYQGYTTPLRGSRIIQTDGGRTFYFAVFTRGDLLAGEDFTFTIPLFTAIKIN